MTHSVPFSVSRAELINGSFIYLHKYLFSKLCARYQYRHLGYTSGGNGENYFLNIAAHVYPVTHVFLQSDTALLDRRVRASFEEML
jgi:hypothetical protein